MGVNGFTYLCVIRIGLMAMVDANHSHDGTDRDRPALLERLEMRSGFQLPLLVDDPTKRQTLLQDISSGDCIISRFNTRKTRPQQDVEKLAERIRQNGFELTRAPWAYRNGKGILEVFAGGTRLEAAQLCQVPIPIILFEGYSDEEIARLETQDNEDDEYHTPVPNIRVWAEYARLRDEEGWEQQQIADAKTKGIVSRVSERLLEKLKEKTDITS